MSRAFALAAALALAAGCVPLEPRPDRTRWYVLDAGASAPPSARAPIAALGVGPVRLPAYLDRPEVVRRAGPARLEVRRDDRWAAPLDVLFTGALAEDLRAAVPAREVREAPWPAGDAPEWSVAVDVLRFEGEPDGTAVLEARWSVRKGGVLAAQGSTRAREPAGAADTAAVVQALRRTIGALAREVASTLGAAPAEAARE